MDKWYLIRTGLTSRWFFLLKISIPTAMEWPGTQTCTKTWTIANNSETMGRIEILRSRYVRGFFLVVFSQTAASVLSDSLSFLKNFAWVFQKSLSFSKKCEFFEENVSFSKEMLGFFTIFGLNFPISWVFCLSFCEKFLEFEFFSPWVFSKT